MTPEKRKLYCKAYVELCEVLKHLSQVEKQLIPDHFIRYIEENRDLDYVFQYDPQKDLLDQDLMTETKALIIQIYERYFSPPEEKEMWDNYHEYCKMLIYEKAMQEECADQEEKKMKLQRYERLMEEEEN